MIQRVEVDGRAGSACFLDDKFVPVEEAKARFLKIVFDDGGQLILGTRSVPNAKAWDESQHPRDPAGTPTGGQFTSGGGGDKETGGGAEPNKEAMTVGGDQWNKDTAERLEKEYASEKPELEALVAKAVGADVAVTSEEDEPLVPDSWDTMSGGDQENAKEIYFEKTHEDYLNSEVEHWQSEYAPQEARQKVATDFEDGSEQTWAAGEVSDFLEDWQEDKPVPFTNQQLLGAISIYYNDAKDEIEITIDDAKLGLPIGWQEGQQTLPGIEPQNPADLLTAEMREDLLQRLDSAFATQAKEVEDDLEPPDYLGDSIKELQDDSWESMDDTDKFAWVEANTDILADASDKIDTSETLDRLPNKFDPLQQYGSADDYTRTRQVGRYLSIERTTDLLVERGIIKDRAEAKRSAENMDSEFWSDWKSSSHNNNSKVLQTAIADELGARLNKEMVDADEARKLGEKYYKGGFAAAKAYVRAKWETTQYLLDKAGQQTVNVYRAVNLDDAKPLKVEHAGDMGFRVKDVARSFENKDVAYEYINKEEAKAKETPGSRASGYVSGNTAIIDYTFKTEKEASDFIAKETKENPPKARESVKVADREFVRLPNIDVVRNGAASTTVDPEVANKWDGQDGRVVLRASVPRTAVVSVPAYGQNIHKEREVVVAGTAWKGWDAWYGRAPNFFDLGIGHQVAA